MKRSFFERLSGSSSLGDSFDSFDDELPAAPVVEDRARHTAEPVAAPAEPSASEGQLPADVYQTPSEIVVRAFVAGVRPDDLNISINRDMIEIGGARSERSQVSGTDYFMRELFWGSFSRTIMLPQEVDVDAASAIAKDGLLTIILPKLDKAKQTKLKVKAN